MENKIEDAVLKKKLLLEARLSQPMPSLVSPPKAIQDRDHLIADQFPPQSGGAVGMLSTQSALSGAFGPVNSAEAPPGPSSLSRNENNNSLAPLQSQSTSGRLIIDLASDSEVDGSSLKRNSADNSRDGYSNDQSRPSKVLRAEDFVSHGGIPLAPNGDSGSRGGNTNQSGFNIPTGQHDSSSRGGTGSHKAGNIKSYFQPKNEDVGGSPPAAQQGTSNNMNILHNNPGGIIANAIDPHHQITSALTSSQNVLTSPQGHSSNLFMGTMLSSTNHQTAAQTTSTVATVIMDITASPPPVNPTTATSSTTNIHMQTNGSATASSKKEPVAGPKVKTLFSLNNFKLEPPSKIHSSTLTAATSSGTNSSGPVAVSSAFNSNVQSDSAAAPSHASITAASAQQIGVLNTTIQQLQSVNADLRRQLETMRYGKEQAEIKTTRFEGEIKAIQDKGRQLEERNMKLCKFIEQLMRDSALQDFRRKRDKLALDCVRLGKISTMKTGPSSMSTTEVWEEGYAIKELNKRFAEHLERKEDLEKRKKKLAQAKRHQQAQAKKGGGGSNNSLTDFNGFPSIDASICSGSGGGIANNNNDDGDCDLDMLAEADAIRSHFEQLKRDEQALAEERRFLETEKASHQKEIKRCQSEERSRFYRELPCLNQRYLLVSIIGKGGFSEVWKALDLLELKDVAVKIHQLNPSWGEDRKSSYIKHVTREYTIHREMKHPRVVQLFDVFEIDENSFATVLEYCKGIDLDEKLKRMRTIPEKDAKTILLQILSGLKYLNTPSDGSGIEDEHGNVLTTPGSRRMAIIHFDLKPANILFDETGDAKITDFGLSKIVDESSDGTSMELTSQGAGTYYYLPPECFAKGPQDGPPRISSKVDVWSLGVIFFQMMYGRKPFGEGKSQERVLSEGIMLNANQVEFPNDAGMQSTNNFNGNSNNNNNSGGSSNSGANSKVPRVSDEAKDLIRACLSPNQRLRPDVFALCQFPYLRNSK